MKNLNGRGSKPPNSISPAARGTAWLAPVDSKRTAPSENPATESFEPITTTLAQAEALRKRISATSAPMPSRQRRAHEEANDPEVREAVAARQAHTEKIRERTLEEVRPEALKLGAPGNGGKSYGEVGGPTRVTAQPPEPARFDGLRRQHENQP